MPQLPYEYYIFSPVNIFAFGDVTFCAMDYLTPRDTTSKKIRDVLHHRENSARDSRKRLHCVRLLIYRAFRLNRLEKCHSRQENKAFCRPRVCFSAVRDQEFHTTRLCCIRYTLQPVNNFSSLRVSKTLPLFVNVGVQMIRDASKRLSRNLQEHIN